MFQLLRIEVALNKGKYKNKMNFILWNTEKYNLNNIYLCKLTWRRFLIVVFNTNKYNVKLPECIHLTFEREYSGSYKQKKCAKNMFKSQKILLLRYRWKS
jgi:hypothetical protein